MKMRRMMGIFVAFGVLWGCGPQSSDRLDQPLKVVSLDVGNRQVYVDATRQQAMVLDPVRRGDQVGLSVKTIPAGIEPGATAVAPDGKTFYVVDDKNDTLGVFDSEKGTRSDIELDAPFDRIAVDPTGDFVVLYFSGTADSNIVARNLKEVGIVDFRASKPKATFLTLSGRPNSFVFAPKFTLGGQEQRLAAVLSDNLLTLVDFNELSSDTDAVRDVPLTVNQQDQVKKPTNVAFDVTTASTDAAVVHAYVLANGTSDVTEIAIQLAGATGATKKFNLAVNQLAAGTAPAAMALLELDAGTRLIAIDRSAPKFTIVDVDSGEGATFDLPMNVPAANLLVYQTTVEVDGMSKPETRVLAYSPNTNLVSVIRPSTIAVSGDEPTLGRSVTAIRLDQPPSRIEPSAQNSDRAIVFHAGASSGFSILDLHKNTEVPIQGGTLADVLFDGDHAYTVYQSLPNLTIFGLDGHPTNFDLPERGTGVFLDTKDNLLLVRHPDTLGMFTVLDANQPTPDHARVYENVFMHKLFDQEFKR